MKRLLALVLTLGLLCLPVWAAPPPSASVTEVEGRGTSENEALQDAFRNAIEKVVGVMVAGQTEVSNFQTVRDRIFTHSEGYVSSYQILDRFHFPDGAIGMRVRVSVTETSIHDDLIALKVLQMQVGNPKLVVSYDPQGPQHALSGLAVERVNAFLASKGVAYVQAPEREAASAAASALADAYVVVSAELRETRRSGDWRFVKARVQISAHDAASGRGLGAETGYSRELSMRSGVQSGYEAAVEEAVRDAAERSLKLIVAHWKSEVAKGRAYQVTLSGIESYDEQRRFTELLKEAGRDVTLERSGGGEARFTVWSREPLEVLLERVMSGSAKSSLKLELLRQDPGLFELRLAKSARPKGAGR